eukprot:jgi/Chlat1/786/Chrsp104S00030
MIPFTVRTSNPRDHNLPTQPAVPDWIKGMRGVNCTGDRKWGSTCAWRFELNTCLHTSLHDTINANFGMSIKLPSLSVRDLLSHGAASASAGDCRVTLVQSINVKTAHKPAGGARQRSDDKPLRRTVRSVYGYKRPCRHTHRPWQGAFHSAGVLGEKSLLPGVPGRPGIPGIPGLLQLQTFRLRKAGSEVEALCEPQNVTSAIEVAKCIRVDLARGYLDITNGDAVPELMAFVFAMAVLRFVSQRVAVAKELTEQEIEDYRNNAQRRVLNGSEVMKPAMEQTLQM